MQSVSRKRGSKEAVNIVVIHSAEYYEGVKDPHANKHDGVVVQHVTFEDFWGCSEFAISTVVHAKSHFNIYSGANGIQAADIIHVVFLGSF